MNIQFTQGTLEDVGINESKLNRNDSMLSVITTKSPSFNVSSISPKTKKFLNIRIPVEFFELLNTKEVFQNNYKAISPCFYFLNRITNLNSRNRTTHGYDNISGRNLSKTFEPYTGGAYKPCLSALEDLGLLVVNDSYSTDNFSKGYKTTPLCHQLLLSSNTEYLKKLHTHKETKQKLQRRINYIMKKQTTYTDYVMNYIEDLVNNLKFDYGMTSQVIESSDWNESTKSSAVDSLIRITEKDFGTLKKNESDNRIWNEFVGLKSDLRKCFTYKDLTYNNVVDIRSCHPTFFSFYILCNYINTNVTTSTNSNSISPTYTLHYVTHIRTCQALKDIINEHVRWIKMFTDTKIDPKELISEWCGYTIPQAKQSLNETLNGSLKWKKLLTWMETHFPILYTTWLKTDVEKTGINISRHFETVLMLDNQLFKYAEDMGIKISQEYDGFGVFSRTDDKDINDKLKFLTNYLKCKSVELWNIPCVIKIKPVS